MFKTLNAARSLKQNESASTRTNAWKPYAFHAPKISKPYIPHIAMRMTAHVAKAWKLHAPPKHKAVKALLTPQKTHVMLIQNLRVACMALPLAFASRGVKQHFFC